MSQRKAHTLVHMSSEVSNSRFLPEKAGKAYKMNIVVDIRRGDSCTIEFELQIGNPKILPAGFIDRYCKKSPRENMSLRLVMFLMHCHHLVFGGYAPKVTHICQFPYSYDDEVPEERKSGLSLKYLDDILLSEDVRTAFDVLRNASFYLWHCGGMGGCWSPYECYTLRFKNGKETENFPVLYFNRAWDRFVTTSVFEMLSEESDESRSTASS